MSARLPMWADRGWYPRDPHGFLSALDSLLALAPDPSASTHAAPPPLGAVAPHASWRYCGAMLGRLFGALHLPRRILILAPSHRPLREPGCLWPNGEWLLPNQERVAVDADALARLRSALPGWSLRHSPHRLEHSIEMVLPFVWRRRPDALVTPVLVSGGTPSDWQRYGEAFAAALSDLDPAPFVLVSTDLDHARDVSLVTRAGDALMRACAAFDAHALGTAAATEGAHVCGLAAWGTGLELLRRFGARTLENVELTTSADVDHITTDAVGYGAARCHA